MGLLSSQLFGSEVFNYSLLPSTIQPGNHAVLRITIPLEKEEDETSVTVNDSLLFESKELHILEKSLERTACCLEIKYELTGYKSNEYVLPPLELKTRGNSFSTETKTLIVQSHRSPEDNELRESFTLLHPPIPYYKWLKRILMALFLISSLLFIFKKLKSRPKARKARPIIVPPMPKEEPLVWLKKQIQLLKLKLKEDPTNPLLVDDWSQMIRGYVERLDSVPALCWTTRELKKCLTHKPQLNKMIPCLETSDNFKFQPEVKSKKPSSSLVEHFIKETETHLILCGT